MTLAIDFNELKATGVLPSPRGVMLAVMRLCQREQASFQELARTVQADPVLAGRIIKIANAMSRNASRPIASVTAETLILVGLQSVRQVALGLSLVTTYRAGGCHAFDYERFWMRSLAMACAAQQIATHVRVAPLAEMFTCGLLAGIGRLGLAAARPAEYAALLDEMDGQPPEALTAAETALFTFNHLSLAAAMMADWNIPRLFSDAVLFHENPHASGLQPDSRQQRLVLVLHAAAQAADFCTAPDEARERMVPAMLALGAPLELDAGQVEDIMNKVLQEWSEWGAMLQIPVRMPPPLRFRTREG